MVPAGESSLALVISERGNILVSQATNKRHELHLLPLNTAGVDPATLSYVELTIDSKVSGSRTRRDFYLFVKLIGLVIVGVVFDPQPKDWRHTKIFPGQGTWDGSVEFVAPGSVNGFLVASVNRDVTTTEKARRLSGDVREISHAGATTCVCSKAASPLMSVRGRTT